MLEFIEQPCLHRLPHQLQHRGEARTAFQNHDRKVDGDGTTGGKVDRQPVGSADHCRSTVVCGGSRAEERANNTGWSRSFSHQRDTVPFVGCVEDVTGVGERSNKGDDSEGETLAATMRSSSTALPSPCHSARSRSGETRRQQLETVPRGACSGRPVDVGNRRKTTTLGTGKPDPTRVDFVQRYEGDGDSREGAGGSQAHGWWSSTSGMYTSGMYTSGGSRSMSLEREDCLGLTSKRRDGGAPVGLGYRDLGWETFPDNRMNTCQGHEHTQAISEALARAEALAR